MKPALPLLAALLVSAAVGGCGGDEEESAADPSSLEGVPWVLVSGVDVDGWEAVAPSLTLEDGQASGSSGWTRSRGRRAGAWRARSFGLVAVFVVPVFWSL